VISSSSFGALQAGTQVTTSTIVPSVKMLALSLRFGIRNEVKMLPSFLRCFPNAEALCIEVKPNLFPTIFCSSIA
jgi:hypothetical protein